MDTNHEVSILTYNDFYEAGELYKTVTKDENWVSGKNHTTEEFKDKQGRIILKRTYNSSIAHDTQYVYDKFGNLTYVLSPKGSDVVMRKNTFNDFSMEVDALSLIRPGSDILTDPDFTATGSATITLSGNQLSIDIDVQYNNLVTLSSYGTETMLKPVPNVKLGEFESGGGVGSYIVSIKEGALSIRGSGIVSSVTENFTITLPEYSPDPEIIDDLCYQYVYDHRNRLVEKKIPGKGWEHIIYDKLDRPVMTQDANLRNNGNDWLFTKYDAFGRVVYTGKFDYSYNQSTSEGLTQRELLQSEVNSQSQFSETKQGSYTTQNGVKLYYSNTVLPISNIELFTINYYDEYTDLPSGLGTTVSSYGVTSSTKTKGLGTVNKVRVLGTTQWITNVVYYNEKAQPIYTYNTNPFLGTTDIVKSDLDFLGKVKQADKTHTSSLGSLDIIDHFQYDHIGRLKGHYQEGLKEDIEVILFNVYDEFGQLKQKDVGNTVWDFAGLQTIDYKYNIRGWLTKINDVDYLGDDLFGFKINYNTLELSSFNSALFNGNISETIWNTKTVDPDTGRYEIPRGYAYDYDGLNRLRESNFTDFESSNYYDYYTFYDYDKNGNILTLDRLGKDEEELDYLYYGYNGNQLESVDDLTGNPDGFGNEAMNQDYSIYGYDANGNLVYDEIKEIDNILYNHLNLPRFIVINGVEYGDIEYYYDANGVKLRKRVLDISAGHKETITDYAGNFIYVEEETGKKIEYIIHPEGYAEPQNGYVLTGDFDYVYQYKDHLGNVRLSYSDSDGSGSINPLTEIISEKNYYPFGLQHKGYNYAVTSSNTAQKFTYNSKEFNKDFGLDLYEMDVRQYNPAIARWTSIDPISHWSMSTYTAFDNNPVFWADPSGADAVYNWEGENKGKYTDKGKVVSFESALASYGLNADGSENNDDNESEGDDKSEGDNGSGNNENSECCGNAKKTNSPQAQQNLEEFVITELTNAGFDFLKDALDNLYWVGKTSKGKYKIYNRATFNGNQYVTDMKVLKKLGYVGFFIATGTEAYNLGRNPSAKEKLEFELNTGLGITGAMHPGVGAGIVVVSGMEAVNNYIFEYLEEKNVFQKIIDGFDKWIYQLKNQY